MSWQGHKRLGDNRKYFPTPFCQFVPLTIVSIIYVIIKE